MVLYASSNVDGQYPNLLQEDRTSPKTTQGSNYKLQTRKIKDQLTIRGTRSVAAIPRRIAVRVLEGRRGIQRIGRVPSAEIKD